MADPVDKINLNGEIRDIVDTVARNTGAANSVNIVNLQGDYASLVSEIYDDDGKSRITQNADLIETLVESGESSSIFQQTDDGFSWSIDPVRYTVSGYVSSSKGGNASFTLYKNGKECTSQCFAQIYLIKNDGIQQWIMSISFTTSYSWNYTDENPIFQIDIYKDSTQEQFLCSTILNAGSTGEANLDVRIISSNGDLFREGNISTVLTCKVYLGTKDVTDQVKMFTWYKYDTNGIKEDGWEIFGVDKSSIALTSSDVQCRATFTCSVVIDI